MEVLLVLVILVVLGSLAVGVYTGIRKTALKNAAQVQVDTLSDECLLFYNDMNSWPQSLQDLRHPPACKIPTNGAALIPIATSVQILGVINTITTPAVRNITTKSPMSGPMERRILISPSTITKVVSCDAV